MERGRKKVYIERIKEWLKAVLDSLNGVDPEDVDGGEENHDGERQE